MKKQGQLLTLQAAAHYLGIAKREVGEMADDGLLRQVKVGGKCYITAQSIARVLGYDPTGVVPAQGRGGKYSKLSFEDYAVRLLNRGVKRAHSRTLNNYRQGVSVLAADALTLWRKALKAGKNRSRAKSRFIFPGRCGKPRSLSGCETMVQKFRKACSLEDRHITLYKFRHTVCTRLVLDQQPIAVIQRIMGDNSPDVIARVYTHVGQEDALRATEGLFAKLPLLAECEAAALYSGK